MFNRIKAKLTSKQGVSLLFALIAFLVASMVAATIVTAAITSLKRVNNDRETLQRNLTLSSAAELVRDEMLNTSLVYEETTNEETGAVTGTYTGYGAFAEEMKAAVISVKNNIKYSSGSSGGTSFSISVAGLMEPVNVSYIMQTEDEDLYKVLFTFTIAGAEERLYLSLQGKETAANGVITYTWDTPYINGLGE